MKIINELKLDFDDVLIKPKRSFVSSRSEVRLEREFYFPHSKKELECIPIMSANMDTTGSLYMAQTLGFHKCITCLHKHYEIEDYLNLYRNYKFNKDLVFLSTGISDNDFEKLSATIESIQALVNPTGKFNKFTPNICVDVANGYTEKFVRRLENIRRKFKDSIIMAGNVVSPEMTEELIIHGGVDIVKVGIGSGCFVAGTKVTTINKKKKIEDIKVGDVVLTHKGRYKKVIGTKARKEKETIVDINGIKCTTNHEFYVVHKSHKHLVNENNLEQYAKWVSAEGLSDDYFLVKIQE